LNGTKRGNGINIFIINDAHLIIMAFYSDFGYYVSIIQFNLWTIIGFFWFIIISSALLSRGKMKRVRELRVNEWKKALYVHLIFPIYLLFAVALGSLAGFYPYNLKTFNIFRLLNVLIAAGLFGANLAFVNIIRSMIRAEKEAIKSGEKLTNDFYRPKLEEKYYPPSEKLGIMKSLKKLEKEEQEYIKQQSVVS